MLNLSIYAWEMQIRITVYHLPSSYRTMTRITKSCYEIQAKMSYIYTTTRISLNCKKYSCTHIEKGQTWNYFIIFIFQVLKRNSFPTINHVWIGNKRKSSIEKYGDSSQKESSLSLTCMKNNFKRNNDISKKKLRIKKNTKNM